jgi:hypothetical protein
MKENSIYKIMEKAFPKIGIKSNMYFIEEIKLDSMIFE